MTEHMGVPCSLSAWEPRWWSTYKAASAYIPTLPRTSTDLMCWFVPSSICQLLMFNKNLLVTQKQKHIVKHLQLTIFVRHVLFQEDNPQKSRTETWTPSASPVPNSDSSFRQQIRNKTAEKETRRNSFCRFRFVFFSFSQLRNPGRFTVREELLNVADPQAGLGGWARLFFGRDGFGPSWTPTPPPSTHESHFGQIAECSDKCCASGSVPYVALPQKGGASNIIHS